MQKRKKNFNVQKPEGMTRRPNCPTKRFRHPIVQCMCSTSFCVMEGSDLSSSCPIKCQNEKKERYPFTGTPKVCSCPVC